MRLSSWRWRNQYGYYGIALLVAVIVCLTSLSSRAESFEEQARKASDFVNSIGVATHLRYLDTAYGQYDNIIKPRLQELGARHIRDGGKDPGFFQKLNDLATIGIKSTLVMDPRDGIDPTNVVNEVIKPVLSSIEAAEGPNEWDVQPQLQYKGKSFPEGVRDYQTELYRAIKSDPATSHIPVLMPSLAFPSNADQLGYLQSASLGNMHSYAGGNLPSQDLDDKWIPGTQAVSGEQRPIVATECGWHNAVDAPNASQPGISEQAGAKYIPRLYLEYFNRGVQRAFVYELINERPAPDQENNFGLLRADGSPKPAFTAVKNLIDLLQDSDANFEPQTLAYSLSGNLADLHHTLLQKRDGRFYMLLWQEVPSFDTQAKVDLNPAARSITLTFPTAMRQITAYNPLVSTAPTSENANVNQLQLNIPDSPLVIELITN